MKFLIESISGKKGYKTFADLDEYVDFMTQKGHLIKTITEADLPYSEKPVELPKVELSDGYEEVDVEKCGNLGKEETEMTADADVEEKQEEVKEFKYESESTEEPKEEKEEVKESFGDKIKSYVPRAGFIRSDDEDKTSAKMGAFVGQGTDDQLKKAKIIAKVKFAEGDRFGRVSSDDLKDFDSYYERYKEIYGEDELDEGCGKKKKVEEGIEDARKCTNKLLDMVDEGILDAREVLQRALIYMSEDDVCDLAHSEGFIEDEELEEGFGDKIKKGLAAAAVAGSLVAGTPAKAQDVEYEKPELVQIADNGDYIDQFGNAYTKEQWKKLEAGIDPFEDNDHWEDEDLEGVGQFGNAYTEEQWKKIEAGQDPFEDNDHLEDEDLEESINEIISAASL